MSKRKLSRQQAWRVEKIQEERAKRAARRNAATDDALTSGDLGPEQEGLVTGDRVVWCAGEPTGVVVAQLERDSVLSRPDPYGKLKPVAANIDQILVVIAPYPEPHANLIDRYLVASEVVGVEPVIVLNKTDLLEADADLAARMEELLAIYPTLGYRILHTSSKQGGLEELHSALRERTSVFVGQSGVGKSSLVNVLLPEAELRVGALSENTQKGTHTTTTAQLFHLECGGSLIDSPGIREFGLWHMTREEVEQGFREFREILGTCKFRDCQHEKEPGCAILAALEAGDITSSRLESYRHIVSSLEGD